MWARVNGAYLKQLYKIGNCPVIHIIYSKRDDSYFCKIRDDSCFMFKMI